MPNNDTIKIEKSDLVNRLSQQKEAAIVLQKSKHEHWKENYKLWRDIVDQDRLLQRQATNFPIMKETGKVWMSKIAQMPAINFKNKSRDDEEIIKEKVMNELWNKIIENNQAKIKDKMSKKIVFLQGRSFKKINFIDGEVVFDIISPWDILIDPQTNVLDIDKTANYIIHTGIKKSLRSILADDRYLKSGKDKLKQYLHAKGGFLKMTGSEGDENKDERRELIESVGVSNYDSLMKSDVIVELDEHFTKLWDEKSKDWKRYIITVAFDNTVLRKEPLEDVLGISNMWPFTTWGSDDDADDIWSDSPADIVRTPNKIINIWFSQLIENRTLRNYGMTWYDSTKIKGLEIEPEPFGLYGIPVPRSKTIGDVIDKVEIPSLDGSTNLMNFMVQVVERATGVVAQDKGVSEKGRMTLGEVSLLKQSSMGRMSPVDAAYFASWKQLAYKAYKIICANQDDFSITHLSKKSHKDRLWAKEISPNDFISKTGYEVEAIIPGSKSEDKIATFQKMMAIRNQMPDNKALQEIAKKKMLEVGEFSPAEVKRIMEEESKRPVRQEKTIEDLIQEQNEGVGSGQERIVADQTRESIEQGRQIDNQR